MKLEYCIEKVEKVPHFWVAKLELTLRNQIRDFYGFHGCDRMFNTKRITTMARPATSVLSERVSPLPFFKPLGISDLT